MEEKEKDRLRKILDYIHFKLLKPFPETEETVWVKHKIFGYGYYDNKEMLGYLWTINGGSLMSLPPTETEADSCLTSPIADKEEMKKIKDLWYRNKADKHPFMEIKKEIYEKYSL